MGMLNNGLILMGLAVSEQMIVRGLIILVGGRADLARAAPLARENANAMFLDVIRRRNPALIEQAIRLHQAGPCRPTPMSSISTPSSATPARSSGGGADSSA